MKIMASLFLFDQKTSTRYLLCQITDATDTRRSIEICHEAHVEPTMTRVTSCKILVDTDHHPAPASSKAVIIDRSN